MRGGAQLSRSGTTSPLGKLSDRLEAVRIEPEVKDAFARKAAESGKPLAEFHREVIRIVALGPDTVRRMHSTEVDRVVGLLSGKTDRG